MGRNVLRGNSASSSAIIPAPPKKSSSPVPESVRALDEVLPDNFTASNSSNRVEYGSILRRRGSGGENAGPEGERHVSFSSGQQEVMQFRADDCYSHPETARGPRRVFGGDVQSSSKPMHWQGCSPPSLLSARGSTAPTLGLKISTASAVAPATQKLPIVYGENSRLTGPGYAQGNDGTRTQHNELQRSDGTTGTRMHIRPGIRDLASTPPLEPEFPARIRAAA